ILEEKPDIFTNQEVFKIRVINLLESRTASLADCFVRIVQIAIALKKIPTSNNFRTLAIAVFNFCYQQLDIFPYILTYFLHPNYRNQGLKKGKFLEICELAAEYYKEAHYNDKECRRCTRLQVSRLESMAQLHSYYISNVEKELKLCDDFAEIEL
ncbi:11077_t:CDS:2, partial [Gigaspora rosea]